MAFKEFVKLFILSLKVVGKLSEMFDNYYSKTWAAQ
jgi:hypothetical protein